MIRPDTPPGCEIVCIDDSPGPLGPTGLQKGSIYTLKEIVQGLQRAPLALVEEIDPQQGYVAPHGLVYTGYVLGRFRYIEPEVEALLRATRVFEDA
jgi:hypothetical protein